MKNPYPLGHPLVLNEFENNDISGYFGLIKCKVSAPKNLYIPVLPYRDANNKLVFPLCAACADNQASNCTHSDEERRFVGTWFSEELKLAVANDYKIEELYEVLHYEQKSEDLFKGYIQKWLKVKTESSGWPASCDTEEKKQAFIRDFEQREGILIILN